MGRESKEEDNYRDSGADTVMRRAWNNAAGEVWRRLDPGLWNGAYWPAERIPRRGRIEKPLKNLWRL